MPYFSIVGRCHGVCLALALIPISWVAAAELKAPDTDYRIGTRSHQTALPLLGEGTHLGMIKTFERLPVRTAKQANILWRDALRAGMKTARVQLDWASLEIGRGKYDKQELREQLRQFSKHELPPFVGIYAIDTEGLVVPEDLRDHESATGLKNSMSIDDPEIVARYRAMLDWAVPIIVEEGGYVLSIANEPDGYMEDFRSETDNVIRFYKDVINHAHQIDRRLAMTVTLTGAPIDAKKFFHDDVMRHVDVATYNYYCLSLTDRFVLRTPLEETVGDDIQKLVAASHGKEVILQELGCPAGWVAKPSVIGTSETAQAKFFELALSAIKVQPKLRAAYVFQMVDWSESLTNRLYIDPLANAGLPIPLLRSLEEWLVTVGFITYHGARVRPAWKKFLEALATGS